MATKKFLQRKDDGTGIQEMDALDSSSGAGDAGEIVALDSTGKINTNMLPSGVGADVQNATPAENFSASNLANFYDDSGTLKARKADAGTNKYPAHGFATGSLTTGNPADFQLNGTITTSGLTPGAKYFLSDTPGTFTATPVSGTGKIHQQIGYAVSTTVLVFKPEETIELV